jgi:hypothetical protein
MAKAERSPDNQITTTRTKPWSRRWPRREAAISAALVEGIFIRAQPVFLNPPLSYAAQNGEYSQFMIDVKVNIIQNVFTYS